MGMKPGVGTPPATVPPMPEFKPVIVPPEDVKACTGMGTAPTADEQVEIIKVRMTDIMPGGYKAPGGTVYGCFWVEIDMPEKRHIIGWEGAVGGDRAVHHQQVSLGAKPFYLTAQGGLCGLPSIEYTWTGERPPEWTPGIAGYPIGGPENGGKARFLFQTHFEGATTYMGGFNAYVTKKLRKYDAGNFEQGDVRGIMIPPKASITHEARCTTDMTTKKLIHPIYVYSSMLHAHLTVKHIKGEHFRGGKLLTTLGEETPAGFAGFFDQSFHPHTPCIEVLPGDELVTTCDYQNPWDVMVVGGEAQNQEMCTTFMQYFPRLPRPSDNFCGTIDSTGGFNGMK
jgi:Copper type II ascorbate-dependent monooxygenase, C-terminal domain